ncbi:gamma-glutamylcyclotransferase [Halobacillus shinanisalinarum]|uniref:Gamma-glutamylcyclotransferase n=1 Tax=Halobacillus shinanisalinarum TaxID=2932258 RepID=A0ABY4GZK3_9BACI|nr:gamma-glutamylcyclotransferase family protein [Halobacillus shinanisalinarum]UOQ93504.1 gamma-glutamylcyclotransferase [Halobacillus shinanisalinarum]
MRVFVYGSLCMGERNHEMLVDSILLSEQAWVNGTLLQSDSYYPYLRPSETDITYGEIYDVSDEVLIQLDTLEGYNGNKATSLFDRQMVSVHTDQGTLRVFVYVGTEKVKGEKIVPHGNWKVSQYLKRAETYYFAYGSCMDNRRFKRAHVDTLFQEVLGGAALEKYRLRFSYHVPDGGRADIEEEPNACVEGLLYKVKPPAIDYLYEREGVYAGAYRPVIINVSCQGIDYRALSFTVTAKQADKIPPLHYAKEIYLGAAPYVSEGYRMQLTEMFTTKLPVKGIDLYLQSNGEKSYHNR